MTGEIRVEKKGAGGWITLNRPQALNALSFAMVESFHQALEDFEQDPEIHFVVVNSEHPKAFCAGGDIRSAYDHRHNFSYLDTYFKREYHLNLRISSYPKPYIALINGYAFGGGMGISIYARHRVATENALLCMPEAIIGFYPDIGATYFLEHLPGKVGRFLGLTGFRVNTQDAYFLGWATEVIPSEALPSLIQHLQNIKPSSQATSEMLACLQAAHIPPTLQGPLATHINLIERCFGYETIEQINAALQAEEHPFASQALSMLTQQSPTSLKVWLAYTEKMKGRSLDEILFQDYCLSSKFCLSSDFFEGIRARVVDKDYIPQWSPANLAEVTEKNIEFYLEKVMAEGSISSLATE